MVQIVNILGEILFIQGELERSTTDLRKILKKNPDVLWLKYLYGSKA